MRMTLKARQCTWNWPPLQRSCTRRVPAAANKWTSWASLSSQPPWVSMAVINVLLHHASSSESSHLLLDLKVDTSAQNVSHSSTHNPLPSCSGPHEQPYNQYTMTHWLTINICYKGTDLIAWVHSDAVALLMLCGKYLFDLVLFVLKVCCWAGWENEELHWSMSVSVSMSASWKSSTLPSGEYVQSPYIQNTYHTAHKVSVDGGPRFNPIQPQFQGSALVCYWTAVHKRLFKVIINSYISWLRYIGKD